MMHFTKDDINILAFVHIEKAAGTSLIHILRHNFFMRCCKARPLTRASKGVFSASDLKYTLTINPFMTFRIKSTESFMCCIEGHSIKPFGGLERKFPKIQYITLFRNPYERYVSNYNFWIQVRGMNLSFEKYLSLKHLNNFQIKKIAGTEDINLAKSILKTRFLLVGVTEKFDEFLILLKKKLRPMNFDPRYRIQNTAKYGNSMQSILKKYQDRIIENNLVDMELYQYVKNVIIEEERNSYGPGLDRDLADFRHRSINAPRMGKRYIDYIVRKLYYEQVTNFIRRINDLPPKGSY